MVYPGQLFIAGPNVNRQVVGIIANKIRITTREKHLYGNADILLQISNPEIFLPERIGANCLKHVITGFSLLHEVTSHVKQTFEIS